MTRGIVLPAPPIDASPEGLRRTLDLARRALRAEDATILASDEPEDDPALTATLSAFVSPDGAPVARLVVHDTLGREWTEDDRAMLEDLAGSLAAEIHMRGERERHVDSSDLADETIAQLPVADHVAAPDAVDPGALRILLADDLDLNRKLISDMLSLDGYVVDSVPDGAAAVEAAKAKPYDLILMDMIMPGMDGMDATRAIRALPAPACDVPIVALTAHSFREQLDNCLHAGMNATLTKPMSFDALSDAVSTWARSRRQAA